MKDSAASTNDDSNSIAIVIVAGLAMGAFIGFNRMSNEIESNKSTITKLEQSIQQHQAYLTQCQSEFRGYKEGRR